MEYSMRSSLARFVHSAQVMHRDVKPENILINGNCKLRLADFGSLASAKVLERNRGIAKRQSKHCYKHTTYDQKHT